MKAILFLLITLPLFSYSQVKFSIAVEASGGGNMGHNISSEYTGSGQKTINKQERWKAPYFGMGVTPAIVIDRTFIGGGVSFNYQTSFEKNLKAPFVEYNFYGMLRQMFTKKKVKPFIDLSGGYVISRYSYNIEPTNEDVRKRSGHFIESGIGVAFGESPVTVRLCHKYEKLKYGYKVNLTDTEGNPIGQLQYIDYLNYVLVKVGFQLK